MNNNWNIRYSEKDFAYGKEPNAYFKQQIDKIKHGRLLLPGEGEGRNAVYAASLGWDVTAVDSSIEGKKKAGVLAEMQNVKIDYRISDITRTEFCEGEYDAVAMIYVHLPSALRASVHNRLFKSLKPGGIFILEAFSKTQLNNNSGGPKDSDMLYTLEEIKEDFTSAKFIELSSISIFLEEGKYHKGKADVIRMIAVPD